MEGNGIYVAVGGGGEGRNWQNTGLEQHPAAEDHWLGFILVMSFVFFCHSCFP